MLTVNPKPVGSASPQAICSGSTTSVGLNSTVLPAQPTHGWQLYKLPQLAARLRVSVIAVLCAGSTIVSDLNQYRDNIGCCTLYTVIPTAGSCTGASFTVDVTVNPTLSAGVASGASPLCIGQTATYTYNGKYRRFMEQ